MILQEILSVKGSRVHHIDPEATLDEVVRRLCEHNIGSLVVCGSTGNGSRPRMLGIITERDILRALSTSGGSLAGLAVRDAMTTSVLTGTPDTQVAEAMGLMTDRRIRHLPIVENGELLGIISIGDVVKAQHDQMVFENHYLKTYIQS